MATRRKSAKKKKGKSTKTKKSPKKAKHIKSTTVSAKRVKKKATRESRIRARALELYHKERESYSPLTVYRMLSESSQAVVVNEQTKSLRKSASGFYSIPGQLNLIFHGINSLDLHHPWLRFHAIQSASVCWSFLMLYTLAFLYGIYTFLFVQNTSIDSTIYLFAALIMIHAFMSILLTLEATRGRQFFIPIIGNYSRSSAAEYYR